jgi:acyl-CoA thioesterase-1
MFKYLLSIFFPFAVFANTAVGIIGDSISLPFPIMPVDAYHEILSREFDWKILNYSQGGSGTDTLMPRLKKMVKRHKPKVLIIALGINDANLLVPIEEIYNNLREAVRYAISKDIHVLLGTVDISDLKIGDDKYYTNFINLYSEIKELYPQIDLFEFLTVEMTSNTGLFYGDYRNHPNEPGHEKIADSIRKVLK